MAVIANAIVVIIFQNINISNQHVGVYLKLTQCYMSNIS